MPRSKTQILLPLTALLVVALALVACGGVDRSLDNRPTPFARTAVPPTPTVVSPLATGSSIEAGPYVITPVNARFVPAQPGLSAIELTLNIALMPSVPVAEVKWGPRLEFTEINLAPFRASASEEPRKLVVRLSWGGNDFVDLRPAPEVSRLGYKIVGGTSRSFVIGFTARIPTRVTTSLTFTILEGTVEEHQDGVADVIGEFPLKVPAPHPGSRLTEATPDSFLQTAGEITVACRANEIFLAGAIQNSATHSLPIGLIQMIVFNADGRPVGDISVNRFDRQVSGNPLDRATDDPFSAGEQSEFGFIIPAGAKACGEGVEWALLHGSKLIATGRVQGA